MQIVPEISTAAIVIVGEFSPIIFHPLWLVERKLISKDEAEAANIGCILQDITTFNTDWLNFVCNRERLQIEALQDPIVRAFDLSIAILSFFPENPVRYLGLNRSVHVNLQSQERRDRLGDLLAPKTPWGDYALKEGKRWAGIRSLTMEWPREEPIADSHILQQSRLSS